MALVRRGYRRLSIDEAVWQRLGQRDAGRVLEAQVFDELTEEVRREQLRKTRGLHGRRGGTLRFLALRIPW